MLFFNFLLFYVLKTKTKEENKQNIKYVSIDSGT